MIGLTTQPNNAMGFMPAYAGSVLGKMEQLIGAGKTKAQGGLTGNLGVAIDSLKGIPQAQNVMKDLMRSANEINAFGIQATGSPLQQASMAFGVDPFALFGDRMNPAAGFGISPFPQQGLFNPIAPLTGTATDLYTQGFAQALQQGGSNPNDILRILSQLGLGTGAVNTALAAKTTPTVTTTATRTSTGKLVDVAQTATKATAAGDPHFYANGKHMFDFQGVSGKSFNIFSDGTHRGEELIINARFDDYDGGNGQTIMGKAGLQVAGLQFTMDKHGEVLVNGKPMPGDDKQLEWNTSIPGKKAGEVLRASAHYNSKSKTLTINSGEYVVTVKIDKEKGINEPFLNIDVQATEAGYAANGDIAGGVQGEILDPTQQGKIADFMAGKSKFKIGKGAQGEGFLKYSMDKYIVSDLFRNDFGYKNAVVDAEYGKQLSTKTGGK